MKSITRSESDVNGSSVRVEAPVSAELLAANQQLLARRAVRHAQAPPGAGQGESTAAPVTTAAAAAELPAHLGWGSAALTGALQRSLRRAAGQGETETEEEEDDDSAESDADNPPAASNSGAIPGSAPVADSAPLRIVQSPPSPHLPISQPPPNTFTTHPSLLLAMLQTEHSAPGRVWLLCRYLDRPGRGWLALDDLRAALTTSQSPVTHDPLPQLSWRRLRQILGQGRGVFWEQDDRGRLWLYGAARVAANLGVQRLNGQPIELPLSVLTGSLAAFRAHCYASFHSGRDPQAQPPNATPAAPIARATLARVTGVPVRTQHAYEQRAGVQVRPNAALLNLQRPDARQEAAFRYGQAIFTLCDRQGRHGRPGQTYTARQLPNSYHMPGHRPASRSRRRRLNRRLQDLVTFQAQGNCQRPAAARRYLRTARELRRTPADTLLFWQAAAQAGRLRFWYSLGHPAA